MTDIPTYGSVPGMGAISQTTEKVVWWGREELLLYVDNLLIDDTARDAANSPTTDMRAGLVMAKETSSGNLYQWDPDATDGREVVHGVLLRDLSMLDADGVAEDKYGHILLAGPLKAADLLIEGTAFTSSTAEHLARRQMVANGKFLIDDELAGAAAFLGPALKNKYVTGDTTVTTADNGARFVGATADCEFTLPTIEQGLVFEFLMTTNHELKITSSEGDNIIVGNDASADSVTWTTSGEQIGVRVKVESIYVNTTQKWLLTYFEPPLGTELGTITFAIGT